ncbi:MAG: hypothetical protein ABSF52_14465 [Syntrophobacteraceae bacterium]|jgi:hypothetical protein
MARICLTLLFSAISVAGLGLVVYAILAGRRRNRESISGESVAVGFSDSAGEPGGVLDLDIGHEGLKHREKEPFDPDKHKPELI